MEPFLQYLTDHFRFNLHGLLNISSAIFSFCVGLIIILNNPKSRLNWGISLLTVSASIWVFNFGLMDLAQTKEEGLFWLGFAYFFGVPFISPFFYLFGQYWRRGNVNKKLILPGFVIAFLLMIPMTFFNTHIFILNDYSWGRYL